MNRKKVILCSFSAVLILLIVAISIPLISKTPNNNYSSAPTSLVSSSSIASSIEASMPQSSVSSSFVSSVKTSSSASSIKASSHQASSASSYQTSSASSYQASSASSITTSSSKFTSSVKASSVNTASSSPYTQAFNQNQILTLYTQQYIKRLKEAVGDRDGKFVFTMLSDSHEHPIMLKNTANNIAAVNKEVSSSVIVHLGDVIDGNKSKSDSIAMLDNAVTTLSSTGLPVMFARGNHDDNSYQPEKSFRGIISNDEWYDHTQAATDKTLTVQRMHKSPSFYVNVPDSKIRLIVLSTDNGGLQTETNAPELLFKNYWGFDLSTIMWLGLTGLQDLPEGWQVMVFSHLPTRQDMDSFNIKPINGEHIEKMLEAFTSGSTYQLKGLVGADDFNLDFSFDKQGKRKVAAFFFGHIHSEIMQKPYGVSFPYISIANSFAYAQENTSILPPSAIVPSPRTRGTLYENLWDTVVVDTKLQKITLVRFGAGSDRTINY